MSFHGDVNGKDSYVRIDGTEYRVKPATFDKYKHCSNAKALVESIEGFAQTQIQGSGTSYTKYFERVKK